MPRSAVGVFARASAPVLEIKPDSPFVVFYGQSSESQDAELTGKLVLTNPESMSVRGIRMTLTGVRRVSWHTTTTVTPQPVTQKYHFLLENLNLFPADGSKNKPHKINAGVHEWDFKFKMPSTLDESVEGLGTNWIVYNLKATVDRGYMSKQLNACSHIRVIRTLGRDMLDTVPTEQINEDIWASKVAYKITVPQKNYIVGTSITADFVLIPLRKGVEISTIKMELLESRHLFCDYAGRRVSHQIDCQVAVRESHLPENSAHVVPDGVEEGDELFDESHRFSMTLDLPKSLKSCRQSVDTESIRISHKLRLYVNLLNPEGHTSQLLVKNHVNLFISPNLPPNEDQSVVVDHNIISQQAMQDEVNQNAPPTYGLHQLDELYNDIDPSGFMTPGGMNSSSMGNSGSNTPFYAQSRTASEEDVTSLDAVAHHQPGGGASATALHNRLQNLSTTSNRSGRYQPARHHSSGGSTPHSGPDETSRAASTGYLGNDGAHVDYDMEALARIPSYNTAVRTPARTPISEDLPTYETATSRPGSPSRTPRSRGSTPSPARSLDAVAEETRRNTEMNSNRESPRHSDEGSSTITTTTTQPPPPPPPPLLPSSTTTTNTPPMITIATNTTNPLALLTPVSSISSSSSSSSSSSLYASPASPPRTSSSASSSSIAAHNFTSTSTSTSTAAADSSLSPPRLPPFSSGSPSRQSRSRSRSTASARLDVPHHQNQKSRQRSSSSSSRNSLRETLNGLGGFGRRALRYVG